MSEDAKTLTENPEDWLREHGDYLYRYAMARLRNEELASDMLQETLLAAWKGSKSFQGKSSVRTWLVGILKHKITDHIRKEIRNRKLSEEIEVDPTSAFFDPHGKWLDSSQPARNNPEGQYREQQFHKQLLDCIHKLPTRQRDVFILREMEGEETETVCNSCEISTTHLHVLMHRARLALRGCLQNSGFGITKKEE
ncbi:MAG: sigma-70 family RNA polymerase sigma factor [Mariprofundaceae bacterium]